jgi:hypothetical protein
MKRIIAEFVVLFAIGLSLLVLTAIAAPSASEEAAQVQQLLGNLTYERTFLSIAICLGFMLPAYWFYLLQRRGGPSTLWRANWTMAYVAFVVHLYWAIQLIIEVRGIEATNLSAIASAVFNSRDLVSSPYFDIAVFAWWTFDVLIAWLPGITPNSINGLSDRPAVSLTSSISTAPAPQPSRGRLIRLQRSILQIVLYVAMTIASVVQGHGLVRVLGFTLTLTVFFGMFARVVRRPFDPESLSGKLYKAAFSAFNHLFEWYQLPTWLAVFNLGALREVLRASNLHGTDGIKVTNPSGLINGGNPPPRKPLDEYERRDDGCYNDLSQPNMGRNSETDDPSGDSMIFDRSHPGARFGRNVPLKEAQPNAELFLKPNPRRISNELLARKEFIPATSLNLLAAAWIQFQTHDWFNHGEPIETDAIDIPLTATDPWGAAMRIRRTRPDPTRDYAAEASAGGGQVAPPTFVNAESHWWDASQIYGNSAAASQMLRTDPHTHSTVPDGKLYLEPSGRIAVDPSDPIGMATSGFVGNWWLGLSLLHTIFVKEHNAICDELRRKNPHWPAERVFSMARMINAALMAKIHTIEWTPAILQNPALQIGMKANWWGLVTEGVTRTLGRISPTEAFSGIPNSGVDHQGTSFSLTEEFVSVYRLHPLMPDRLAVDSIHDGRRLQEFTLPHGIIGAENTLITTPGNALVTKPFKIGDLWYSFGRANAGAITLHNYPNYLRDLSRESPGRTGLDGKRALNHERIDLAAIDIIRDRERGLPRYNQFRRLFHRKAIRSFDDFENSLHPNLGSELRAVYGQDSRGRDNVELLDLMIGMFAEVPPEGFGFSDTAFRVFILMASRRLKSDRFIAQGFNENVFSREGIEWVNDNSMLSVIRRHHPELSSALYGINNAFVPWRAVP